MSHTWKWQLVASGSKIDKVTNERWAHSPSLRSHLCTAGSGTLQLMCDTGKVCVWLSKVQFGLINNPEGWISSSLKYYSSFLKSLQTGWRHHSECEESLAPGPQASGALLLWPLAATEVSGITQALCPCRPGMDGWHWGGVGDAVRETMWDCEWQRGQWSTELSATCGCGPPFNRSEVIDHLLVQHSHSFQPKPTEYLTLPNHPSRHNKKSRSCPSAVCPLAKYEKENSQKKKNLQWRLTVNTVQYSVGIIWWSVNTPFVFCEHTLYTSYTMFTERVETVWTINK